MFRSPALAALVLRVDELLLRPGNMDAARTLAEACLDDEVQGHVDTLFASVDPPDFDEPSDVALTPGQTALVLAAFHAVHCPGVEKVITISDEPLAQMTMANYKRALRWKVTRDRIEKLGDNGSGWLTLQLRRFEQILETAARCPRTAKEGDGFRITTSDLPGLASSVDRPTIALGQSFEPIRNWLIHSYLLDPFPRAYPELGVGGPMVFARHGDFTSFLLSLGVDVLSSLETCRSAGWIEDFTFDIRPGEEPTPSLLPFQDTFARLKLSEGAQRIVGIRHGVLTAIPLAPQPDQTESPTSSARLGSEAAERQAISDPGPFDQFARRHRIRELAEEIEELVRDYFDASEPLREALNGILRADSAQWIGRLHEVQPYVRGLKLTESRFGSVVSTEIQSARSLARHTLIYMGDSIVQDNRTRFDALCNQLRAEPAAESAAQEVFPEFVSVVLTHSYRKTRPEFLERAKAALAGAGLELWWAVGDDFKKVGSSLSARAADAIRHWCDPFDVQSRFSDDGLLAPPGWRRPNGDETGAASVPNSEVGPNRTHSSSDDSVESGLSRPEREPRVIAAQAKPQPATMMQIMRPQPDVLLVTVNENETRAVHELFEAATGTPAITIPLEGLVYHNLGRLNETTVFHVISEIGSSSIGAMQQTVDKAIRALDPGAVIAVGVAFGVNDKKQSIGDILLSKQLRPYDLQRVGSEIILRGDKPHASARLVNHFRTFADTKWKDSAFRPGVVLTGEKLIDNIDYRDQLVEFECEAVGGEMEGGGLYVSCQEHKVDWIVIKAICDWADGNKATNKKSRQKKAANNAAQFLIRALQYAPLKRQD